MAQLFASIEEFKVHVGGAINNDEAMLESIASDITAALDDHLRNWLGDTLTDEILDAYPDADEPLSILTEKVQAALAPLALSYAPDTKGVEFSKAGLTRPELGTFQYQDIKYESAFLKRGYEAIELLLKYLDKNAETFTNWTEKTRHRSVFLNYASDFRRYSSQRISRYTFEALLPIIAEVEYFAVEKLLPRQFFDRLKNPSVTPLSEAEKMAIAHIKAIVANFTVTEATRRNRVKIVGADILQVSAKDTDIKAAAPVDIERTATYTNLAADRQVMKMMDYLTRHKADYPLCFHTVAGGENDDTDAFGYVASAPTLQELQASDDARILESQKRVVSL